MKKTPLITMILCAWGWSAWTTESELMRRQAVTQAREILGVRQSLIAHVQARYPNVKVEQRPGELSFFLPSSALFAPEGTALSPSGEVVMGVLRDVGNTFRTLYVDIRFEKGAAMGGALKTSTRRTMGLGAMVFRGWGVPPANIFLRVHASEREGYRLVLRTKKPDPVPVDQELPSVMVHMREPVLKFGVNPLLPIDVSLLARSGIRKWSLRLIDLETGVAVKEFSGTSDRWVTLLWDGRKKNGEPADAGEYQAFLTAEGYGRDLMTDSAVFVVQDPPSKILPPSPVAAKSVPSRRSDPVRTAPKKDDEPQSRRWAFVVRFSRDRADLAGSAALEIRQLAATLKTFPNEKVVVEGFSDLDEKEARALAGQRARVIKDQLVDTYDIDADRLIVRAQEPRAALEGENMHKTVTFFVGVDGH